MSMIPFSRFFQSTISNTTLVFCCPVREQDKNRSNEVLATLRKYLSSLPFLFQNASIITGQEEGLYGWITVNYLMGNFIEVRHGGDLSGLAKRSHSVMYCKHIVVFAEEPVERLRTPRWSKDCRFHGPWRSINTDCLFSSGRSQGA